MTETSKKLTFFPHKKPYKKPKDSTTSATRP